MYAAVADDEMPVIASLINRSFRGAGSPTEWSTATPFLAGDRTTVAALRADLQAKPSATLLKWVDGGADGPAGCVWLESLGGGTWYLGSLAIEPARQNSGLGRTMLLAAEQWIAERGGRRVRMTVVNVRDALVGWYVRRGYHLTGESKPFPYGEHSLSVPLGNDYRLVVLEKELKPY